uniref:Uncharacterized protein n=1 Tax=Aegilops tauschii subsp. strangulata TaxID=200361 RepID=A0A453SXM8_AEGTS
MDDYLKGCRFLPKLSNEILEVINVDYRDRWASCSSTTRRRTLL